jgi:hypothetical protein
VPFPVATIGSPALVFGLGAFIIVLLLLAFVLRHARRTAADLRAPRFHTFASGAMPRWVEEKLAPLRDRFSTLGFRHLVSYTRESQRLNYTMVLVSNDDVTSVHLWVSHFRGLMRWLTILRGWRAFVNDMLILPRWALLTYHDADRLYESTPVDLSNMSVPGLTEYLQVPEATSAADALREHASGAKAFAARTGATQVAVTTVEQFLERERVLARQVADQMERVMATSYARPKEPRSRARLVILWLFLVLGFTVMWQFLSRGQ